LKFEGIKVQNELRLNLSSSRGETILSGLELIREDTAE